MDFNRVALMLLRKAMDMKLAIIVHRSNSPFPAKPGEKKEFFSTIFFCFLVFLFLLKLRDRFSAVRVPRLEMKMRILSRGVSTPYIFPILVMIIKATLTERIETPIMVQLW